MRQMTTKEVQQICLDILKDVHEFCVENGIHYSLSGGTLLGAIRHKGFIPWDDDADIQMPRADYEAFIRTYKSKRGYKLLCPEITKSGDVKIRLSKVCEVEKTVIDQGPYRFTSAEVGINVDIIPVDGAPDDYMEAKKHLKKLISYLRLLNAWRTSASKWSDGLRYNKFGQRMKFYILKTIGWFLDENVLEKALNTQKEYDYSSSNHFFAGPHYGMREWQPKKNMESFILHKFEDAEFYIMSGYEENLKSLFGDYMKLPPENQRVTHDYNRYFWKE